MQPPCETLAKQGALRYHGEHMDDQEDPRQLERLARLIEQGLDQGVSRRDLIRRGLALGLSLPSVAAALSACGLEPPQSQGAISPWRPATPSATPAPPVGLPQVLNGAAEPVTPAPSATAEQPIASATAAPTTIPPARFAVIGDYGMEGEPAAAVAALVAAWAPDFVLTLGDNNYPDGAAETIDRNVGQYYSAFISPYRGAFGPGASESRFFPTLGNHDWVVGYPEPYLAYFSPPGNGRYYRLDRGPLSIFCLDSMPGEPDGWTADSAQAAWLKAELAASPAPWKLVAFHHAPYTSGHHGPSSWMQWPFAEWGARLVLAGHDHTYERISRDGITYVVNGLGGGARYAPGMSGAEGSLLFFNADHGAMLVEADAASLRARFVTRAEKVIDDFVLT